MSTDRKTGDWIEVGKLEDIPRLGARVVETPAGAIALFRTRDDEIFALDDKCPHKGGPLSQGIVHGKQVTCPLHNWRIQFESGQAVAPDQGCVKRYAVHLEAGTLCLSLTPL